MVILRHRMEVDERDGINRDVVLLHREQFRHGRVWNEDTHIRAVVLVTPDLVHESDHVKTNAIEQDGLTEDRTSREEILAHLPSNEGHMSLLLFVQFVQPRSEEHTS